MNRIHTARALPCILAAFILATPAVAPAQEPAPDAAPAPGADTSAASRATAIAEEFMASGDPAAAALEYRHLAACAEDSAEAANLHALAAEAYRRAGDWNRMSRMIDSAEDDGEASAAVTTFLRMRLAEGRREWVSSMLYAESLEELAGREGDDALLRYARSVRAADALRAGRRGESLAVADGDPALRRSVESYLEGRDKSPRIGGLLGIIPGMGYAYSGEYGNMLRSILLNGLFIWAMAETAEEDQWALFSVATFFELTWFSGSIYGGIDSAHRANAQRLDAAVSGIMPKEEPRIRAEPRLDIFRVRLEF